MLGERPMLSGGVSILVVQSDRQPTNQAPGLSFYREGVGLGPVL